MSKKGEYGEPWSAEPEFNMDVHDKDGRTVCQMGEDGEIKPWRPFPFAQKNMERIVACTNALNGLDPEKLGALIEAAKVLRSKLGEHVDTFPLAVACTPEGTAYLRSITQALTSWDRAADALGVPRG